MFFWWVLACAGPGVQALAAAEAGTGDVFKLREASVFAPGQKGFQLGQAANCEDKPSATVRNYPVFASKKPVFGSVCFAEELLEICQGSQFGRDRAVIGYIITAIDKGRGKGGGKPDCVDP